MPRFSYRPASNEDRLPKYRKHRASGQDKLIGLAHSPSNPPELWYITN